MDCVVLVRMSSGKIVALMENEYDIRIFSHPDSAVEETQKHPLCKKMPYQIVECDEL